MVARPPTTAPTSGCSLQPRDDVPSAAERQSAWHTSPLVAPWRAIGAERLEYIAAGCPVARNRCERLA